MIAEPSRYLEFVYTALFERTRQGLLDENGLLELEDVLCTNPRAGRLEPETGGVRKLRVGTLGRGRRGGARVLYVHVERRSRVYLLCVYAKSRRERLRPRERKLVQQLVKDLLKE